MSHITGWTGEEDARGSPLCMRQGHNHLHLLQMIDGIGSALTRLRPHRDLERSLLREYSVKNNVQSVQSSVNPIHSELIVAFGRSKNIHI